VADALVLFGAYFDFLEQLQNSGPSSMACSLACSLACRQRSKAVGVGGAGTQGKHGSVPCQSWQGRGLELSCWAACNGKGAWDIVLVKSDYL
jgi:hypothetical protein